MRLMDINKREFYYSTYIGKNELADEYGNLTGEYALVYSDPILSKANYSSTKGESLSTMFGDFDDYDRVLLSDTHILSEQTRLWIDDRNPNNPHDYEVVKVGDSINYYAYAIKKVRVAIPTYYKAFSGDDLGEVIFTDDKSFTLSSGQNVVLGILYGLSYLRLVHLGDASLFRKLDLFEVNSKGDRLLGGRHKALYSMDLGRIEVDGTNYLTVDPKTLPQWNFVIDMVTFAPDKDEIKVWGDERIGDPETDNVVLATLVGDEAIYIAIKGQSFKPSETTDYDWITISTAESQPWNITNIRFYEADIDGSIMVGGRSMYYDDSEFEHMVLMPGTDGLFAISDPSTFEWPKWDFYIDYDMR